MGLFQHKKKLHKPMSEDEALQAEEQFFDEYFREELRNHGRWYFEKIIKENGKLFKADLDATIQQINTDLKEHTAAQIESGISQINAELKEYVKKGLDDQFAEFGKTIQEAQEASLTSLQQSAQNLQEQYSKLSETVEKTLSEQEAALVNVSKESMERMGAMKEAQDAALDSLKKSVETLQEQQKRISESLEKNVADQEAVLIAAFEDNMARIVEHYLLGAFGDQFDLKAQLPSIIQQMETNKQAMVDDMKL